MKLESIKALDILNIMILLPKIILSVVVIWQRPKIKFINVIRLFAIH